MESFLLSDIEDRTLAMADGEYVHFKIARPVLGTYYERNECFYPEGLRFVSKEEIAFTLASEDVRVPLPLPASMQITGPL